MRVWSLGWEDSLEEGMATHCSVLREYHRQRRSHGIGHDWSDLARTHTQHIVSPHQCWLGWVSRHSASVPPTCPPSLILTDFFKNPFHLIQGQFIQLVKTCSEPHRLGPCLPTSVPLLLGSSPEIRHESTPPAQTPPWWGAGSRWKAGALSHGGPCRKADAGLVSPFNPTTTPTVL